jgi:hypothetical protein
MNSAPIVYIVFNRPNHTTKTFAVLREQRPTQLFIIADGPRPGHPADAERCAEVRAIVEQIDWPCEVHRNYADSNMGLKRRVSSGLDWVFTQADRAIVLEDDCAAHPDFFRFCNELLEHYAEDSHVSVITGNNFQNGRQRGNASYYFSKFNHCWGWATWRRAWQHYQGDLSFWPEWRESDDWKQKTPDPVERRYWVKIFDQVHAGQINSWAYSWTASVWHRGGLTVTPNVNLVSNIGFGEESTHTASADSPLANIATVALGDVIHPLEVLQDKEADRLVFEYVFGGRTMRFPWSLFNFPRRIAGYLYRNIKRSFA